ncbi:MAG: LbtU family siderophore porin [bacterium]
MAAELVPSDKIEISGIIEVEAQSFRKKFIYDPNNSEEKTESDSDITLATIEVGIDAEINPSIQGHVLFLWEEDETEEFDDFLDEATITVSNPEKCNYYFTAGKMYLPFGSFESNFVIDPMTLEVAEINQTAIRIGHKKGFTDISFGFFNGDVEKIDKDNEINSFFANASIAYSHDQFNMNLGLSYLSNMADTENMQAVMNPDGVNEYTQGMGVFFRTDMDTWYFSAEYLATTENFDPGQFDPNETAVEVVNHIRPETYNLEFGLKTRDKACLALKYERADDLNLLDLPEERFGVCLSYSLYDDVLLSLEYLREKFDKPNVNKDKNDIVTAQLAIAF